MRDYPLTPEEFRDEQRRISSERLLLHCSAEGTINGLGSAGGEFIWTTHGIAYRPGSLDKLTFKAGRLHREWPVEEIVEIEVRRGRPVFFSVSTFLGTLFELVIAVPILAIFTLGIGAIMWFADRLAGTHLIVKTESDKAWFFLKKTQMADAENALSMFDVA